MFGRFNARDNLTRIPLAIVFAGITVISAGAKMQAGTRAVGQTLDEAGLLVAEAAKVLAVRRRDGAVSVNPQAGTRLEEGDLVIALGTEEQLFATAAKLR